MRRLALPSLLIAALAVAASSPLLAQTIQRSLLVSVLDQSGAPVPGLGPSDFAVREDRVAREVLKVTRATDPMQIALLVDDSAAADAYLTDYRESLKAFVATIAGDTEATGKHSVALITLAARPTIRTDYTTDADRLLKAAGGLFIQQDSSACLLDGVFEVSEGITKRGSRRPVIVAITTEGPEVSNRSYNQVLDMLRRSGAQFHVVVVGPSFGAGRGNSTDRFRVFDEGTRAGGGRYDSLLSSRALTRTLGQLAFELTHQYLVTYAHPDSLIPPDAVTVSSTRQNLTTRGLIVRDAIEERR